MKAVLTIILLSLAFIQAQNHTQTLLLMGSRFSLTAVAADDSTAQLAVSKGIAEIKRIESLISSWNEESETSAINHMAGEASCRVSSELFDLIFRSKKISQLTDGAFDISFAGIDQIWKFDGSMTSLPDSQAVHASVKNIDWQKINLEAKQTVFLPESDMRIGFGAIGKGYAANRAKGIMQQAGATGGLVNAGGDLTAWGDSPEGQSWGIAIANPVNPDQPIGWIDIQNMAVVTSGNYERFAMIEGQRYGHIIDPRTGWPAQGLVSVTVVCPDAELADALATAVFVLGKKKGLDLINQLVGIECLVIDEKGKWFSTDGLEIREED